MKLSPVHPKKPKIVAMPYPHAVINYLYICRDQHGWYLTFSLYTAVRFYTHPNEFNGERMRNLPKDTAMRLALSNIMRTGKGN